MGKCLVCGKMLYESPILEFQNLPRSAQYMPDESNVAYDFGIELKIMQCSGCGLVQIDEEPVEYYKEVIRASSISSEMNDFRLKQFRDFINEFDLNNKKLVEFACGKGEYLSILAKLSLNAYGIEYRNESVEECKSMGLNVEKGFVDSQTKMLEGPFDGFICLNFLEHQPDPNSFLKGIYNNLSEDSYGIIEVPNFDMMIKEGLFSEFVLDHLTYFTKQTLSYLLNQNGFDVIRFEDSWDQYVLTSIVKKRNKIDLSDFKVKQDRLITDLQNHASKYNKDKVVVWGAGHQALTLLALAEMQDYVAYVVDSAEFKQGKYTHVTHLNIKSPKVLEYDDIDTVIVMAGGYSDEIAMTIKEKYKHIETVVVRKTELHYVK